MEIRAVGEDGGVVTDWRDAEATSAGTWSATLSCPIQWFWMRIEARFKDEPDSGVRMIRRFGVGHVVAIWGSTAATELWSGPNADGSVALPSIMDRVRALREDRRSNGCQWQGRFRTPDTDDLPPDVRQSGKVLTIREDISFEGWDFTGYMLSVRATVSLRNCILGERDGATGLLAALDVYDGGGYDLIEYCDFIGPSSEGGYGLFMKLRTGANRAVETPIFRRNRIWGHGSDAIKPNKGRVEFNYFDTQINLDAEPIDFDPDVTIPTGTLVWSAQGHVWRAVADVTGIAPPSAKHRKSDHWTNLDPHADQITVDTCDGGLVIFGNYLNRDKTGRFHSVAGRSATGINNCIRLARNNNPAGRSAPYDKVTVEYNFSPSGAALDSYPMQVKTPLSEIAFTPPDLRHNIMSPAASGLLLHPDTADINPIWSDNAATDGSPFEKPDTCVFGESVAVAPDDMCQTHWRDEAGHFHAASVGGDSQKGLVDLARHLMAIRPGERFMIVHHTQAGSSMEDMISAHGETRVWSRERLLHDSALIDGQRVGLAVSDWPLTVEADGYAGLEVMRAFFTGKDEDDVPLSFPATPAGARRSVQHSAAELYGAETRWQVFGSKRHDIIQNMRSGTRTSDDHEDDFAVSIAARRNAIARFLREPAHSAHFNAALPELLTEDSELIARPDLIAEVILTGLLHIRPPEFDFAVWQETGAYLDLKWRGGTLTTISNAAGIISDTASFAHWTHVCGFEINGNPAVRTEIVGGGVRVFPNSDSFSLGDVVQFGSGRGTGQIKYPEDIEEALWRRYPVADLGAGATGLPVTAGFSIAFPDTLGVD